jgi:lipopolysaccharide transport system ATP-binding protein
MLVDEVLAVGDTQFQSKCLGKMQDVSRSGRTVVFVSHSMSAIRRLCTRAILLSAGEVEIEGAVDCAIEAYLSNDATQDFTGSAEPKKPAITRASVRWAKGDGMLLEVAFDSPVKLTPPILGFVIYDTAGTPVFGSNSIFDRHDSRPHSMQRGTISVQVATAALQPGTYYISLWLSDRFDLFSHADRALRVEIEPGTDDDGRPPVNQIGSVRLNTRWSYSAEGPATCERQGWAAAP